MFTIIDDIAMHVRIDGPDDAPAVVLLHSLGTNAAVWDPQVEVLKRSYHVIRPDLRGHGLTEATPGDYTIARLAEDIARLLDRLEIARPHLGGISIGGMVAQQLAAANPGRFASLILCDTAMAIPPADLWHRRVETVRRDGLGAIEDDVLARWVTPGFMADAGARALRTMLRRTSIEGYAGCAAAIAAADLAPSTAGLAIPALVIVGSLDASTPVTAAEALHGALPEARLVVIDGAAHIPTFEAPEPLTAAMVRFLGDAG